MGKSQKNYMSIKSKLMAAVAMLLVASFMVVSSTYAWFTLSTAPEVTGIQTKIGANGSLEMALLYYNHKTDATMVDNGDGTSAPADFTTVNLNGLLNEVGTGVGTSVAFTQDAFVSNKSWGNIVTLDLAEYGLDKVTLLPSSLNATVAEADGTKTVTLASGSPLYTPTYGSDGRIEALEDNTLARLYNDGTYSAEGYGVRILGTASGMAAHEMGYTNAKSNAASALNKARSYSQAALGEAAKTLGSLLIDKGMQNIKSSYDITGLKQMIANLQTANDNIAKAIRYYMEAEIANQSADVATEAMPASQVYTAILGELNKETDVNLVTLVVNGGKSFTGTIGENTQTMTIGANATLKKLADQYVAIQTQITAADNAYKAISTPGAATYEQAVGVVNKVVDVDSITVEGKTAAEIEAMGFSEAVQFFMPYATTGVNIEIAKGTAENGDSVFAKFAIAVTKNLTQSTTLNIVLVEGTEPAAVKGIMKTTVGSDSLASMQIMATDVFPEKPAETEGEEKILSDYYGYGIDLAFRTNAANSNLCLQIDPAGRIYSDGADSTMGNGSNMTFKVDYTAWGLEVGTTETYQYATEAEASAYAAKLVARLADAIRIVFTDENGNVVSFAKLAVPMAEGATELNVENMDLSEVFNATTNELKLPIMLYTVDVTEGKATVKEAVTHVDETTGETVIDTPAVEVPTGLVYNNTTWQEKEYATDSNNSQAIMPLNQNTATALSVTVYLDGNYVDNSMVAPNGTISMGGQLNLQFSSDADLTAMSYTPLQGGSGSSSGNEENAGGGEDAGQGGEDAGSEEQGSST